MAPRTHRIPTRTRGGIRLRVPGVALRGNVPGARQQQCLPIALRALARRTDGSHDITAGVRPELHTR